jgi:hypothetical protein
MKIYASTSVEAGFVLLLVISASRRLLPALPFAAYPSMDFYISGRRSAPDSCHGESIHGRTVRNDSPTVLPLPCQQYDTGSI